MGRAAPPLLAGWYFLGLLACASGQKSTAEPATVVKGKTFRYAGWLQTVKKALGEAWTPMVTRASGERDPTGCLYSFKDRRTVLEFAVAPDGRILDVKVTSSSGVQYIDQVAIDAFQAVGKFDPPPAGMLETVGEKGLVLPFAFTLLAAKVTCQSRPP